MKVSVILPVYNGAAFLDKCLQNICGQSLSDIEVIVVNDGSKDASPDIAKKWQLRDSRVRLINQKNAGSGAARNKGLDVATGEFVAFMDADDWYPEETVLEVLYRTAREFGCDIAGGSFQHVFADGRIVDTFKGIYRSYTFEATEKLPYSDYQFDYGYHRFLFRKELLDHHRIRFPDYLRYQDPPFFVRAMIAADNFCTVPDRVYSYRKGHQNVTWNGDAVQGLLYGLTDNLLMSRAQGLSRLHMLTLSRLCREYREPVLAQAKNDFRIYFCHRRFWAALDVSLISSKHHEAEQKELLHLDFAYGAFAASDGVPRAFKALLKTLDL